MESIVVVLEPNGFSIENDRLNPNTDGERTIRVNLSQ